MLGITLDGLVWNLIYSLNYKMTSFHYSGNQTLFFRIITWLALHGLQSVKDRLFGPFCSIPTNLLLSNLLVLIRATC